MTNKLGQEPAFGIAAHTDLNDEPGYGRASNTHEKYPGMSKRFYAACSAMRGLLSADAKYNGRTDDRAALINDAYKFADELLKQENL